MRCRINRGAEQVFAPNGNESLLFTKINSITNDFQTALDTYAIVETEGFTNYNNLVSDKTNYDLNGEPDLQTFMNYVNRLGSVYIDKTDVISFMQSAGYSESSDLLKDLSKIEDNGIPIFSKKSLESTGIFSKFEADLISTNKERQEEVKQVLKWLRLNNDISLSENSYITNGEQLLSGKNEVEVDINEENLVDVNRQDFSTSQTLLPTYNERLAEDISFILTGVSESSWDTMGAQITSILENIEEQALNNGVDVVGLTEQYYKQDRDTILDMVDAVNSVLEGSITPLEFDTIKQEFFGTTDIQEARNINTETDVIIKDNLLEDSAFEQGMIKISEDVFRRITNLSYEELLVIQARNENITVDELDSIVNAEYDRGLYNGREIFLWKRNQNIETGRQFVNTNNIGKVEASIEYLLGDFITDFAKVADKNYFTIDFKGITFKDPQNSEKALATLDPQTLYYLEQYSLISPYIQMPYNIPTITNLVESQVDRIGALGNPTSIPEHRGAVIETGDSIAIKNRTEQFLTYNGQVYEFSNQNDNVSFYKVVETFQKPVMESNVNDFTSLATLPKSSTQHRVQNTKEIKEKNFNC